MLAPLMNHLLLHLYPTQLWLQVVEHLQDQVLQEDVEYSQG
jgi:hypothetical protein